MASARPFVVSAALTGIAIGYSNPDVILIADKVLPRVPVGAEKFKWMNYATADAFTVPDTLVGRKGRVQTVEFGATESTSSTKDYGLGDMIPQTDIDQARAMRDQGLSLYDPEKHSAAFLTSLILADREVRVANVVQDANNYNASRVTALAGTARFDDYVNSDPISVISAAIDSTFIMRANQVTMGFAVWQKLRSHPKLVNAVKGNVTGSGIITQKEFGDLFEIPRFHVGQGWINTARKGQPANIQRIWGKSIAFHFIDNASMPETGAPTWGFSPQFGARLAGTIMDSDIGLKGGHEVRVGEMISELVVAPDCGALLQTVIS